MDARMLEAEELWKKAIPLVNESPDEAIKLYTQAISIYPKHMESYADLVYVYRQSKGDPKTAISIGLEALKLDPAYPRLIEQVGKAYVELGEFDQAFRVFNSIELEQATVDTLGYLAAMYAYLEDFKFLEIERLFRIKCPGQEMRYDVIQQIKYAFEKRKSK